MSDHAKFSPSRLERILACPGSVQLIDSLPVNPDAEASPYAMHGTLLHRATDEAGDLGIDEIEYIGAEDKELVQECLDYKQRILNGIAHKNYSVYQELRVSLEPWGIPEVYGTLDLGILDRDRRHADIVDWKFGSGVTVYALWNPQLLSYAAGFIGKPHKIDTVSIHIVQPAIEHYDRWTINTAALENWLYEKLAAGIALAQGRDPKFNPGLEQCRWCRAAATCKARYEQTKKYAEEVFNVIGNMHTVDNAKVAELLGIIPDLKQAMGTIQKYAHNELEQGRDVPGFKLVAGRKTRAWKDEDGAYAWLSNNTDIEGEDLLTLPKLKSPHQVESMKRVLKKDESFKALIDEKEGNPSVVLSSHPKPALNPSRDAIDVFKHIGI